MKMQRVAATLLTTVTLGVLPPLAKAQSSTGQGTSTPSHTQPGTTYTKPTHEEKLKRYLFDAFGPYAIIGAAGAAGVNQASSHRIDGRGTGTPPEWGGGAGAYFQRFASKYGINITANTYRYGLGALLHEDTSYYPCERPR